MSAVVRYNLTPVDGLFATGLFVYALQLTCRGTVSVRLVQFDVGSGTETDLVKFDVSGSPPSGFTTITSESGLATAMDFVN